MGQGVLLFGAQLTLPLQVATGSPASLMLTLVTGDLGGTDTQVCPCSHPWFQ